MTAPRPRTPLALGAALLAALAAPSAAGAGPFGDRLYVRAGVAHVAPLESSRELALADVDGASSLAVRDGPIVGSGAAVSGATIGAAIVGYRLTPRWSVETVLALAFTVKFRATGTLADESLAPMALGLPTGVPPLGGELGEARALPPVITAVYQLRARGRIRPYVGAGASVLFAYGERITNPVLTEASQPTFTISPAPGLALQAGAEALLWRGIYARVDVKFIALMLARASVANVQVRTPELPIFETVDVGTAKMSVWVNPLIVQAGLGLDF